MSKKFMTCFLVAIFMMCFCSWAQAKTDLPKAPNWRFGDEIVEMKGVREFIPPPRGGYNEAVENQKIINSWGYGARPIEEIKNLLPAPFYNVISRPELYGDFRVNETEYLPPSGRYWEAYKEATEKYKGTCYLDEKGWLCNYKAGLPFPDLDPEKDPRGALKLAWNFLKRKQHDDRKVPGLADLRDRGGNVRVLKYDNIRMMFNGRLEIDPKPLYDPNPTGLDYCYSLPFVAPYGMRGIVPLVYRYATGGHDDFWMYLPAMRRVRRMAATQTQDKMPGGLDATWDSAESFMGNVLKFDFTYLGRKEQLLPLICSVIPSYDLNGLAGVDAFYQKRDWHILKATYKKPITTTDITFYIDPEMFYSCYSMTTDMRGKDWVFHMYMRGRDGDWFQQNSNMNMVDMGRRHISRCLLSYYHSNYGYSARDFSMEQLIKAYSAR